MSIPTKNTYLSPRNTRIPERFPSISQPKIIGSFSLNENREYLPDTRNCKYIYAHYKSDQVNYDLNEGIERVIRKPDSSVNEKLTHLLEFIVRNRKKLGRGDDYSQLSINFVCFRGLLRLLMCTPYEHRDAWIILASRYKGTIYLCAQDTEQQTQDRLNRTETMQRILSYGFKFEQFILSDNPSEKPATHQPVNECEEFCCMFSTTLNGQKIVYGAEMDGIECDQRHNDLDTADLNRFNFVELKVKIREQNQRQMQNYHRFKLRNWWCQSFLVNIKKIIVGTRTTEGIVDEVSTVNVKEIPRQCEDYWSASKCMEFCSEFLKLVADEMKAVDSPYDVFRFEFDPSRSHYIFMKSIKGRNEFSFLPEWYIKEMNTRA